VQEYRERRIDAPAREWLDVEQAANYLELSVGEFLERVNLKVFPEGSLSSLREPQWYWQTIQSLSWLRPWLDQVYAERKRATRKKDAKDEDE
jgi:hypothetical protein